MNLIAAVKDAAKRAPPYTGDRLGPWKGTKCRRCGRTFYTLEGKRICRPCHSAQKEGT